MADNFQSAPTGYNRNFIYHPGSSGLVWRCCVRLLWFTLSAMLVLGGSRGLWAVTPQSPEVRTLIERGLKFLEQNNDNRLGGKCLVGLAFLKDGAAPDHPRIVEAVEACRATESSQIANDSVYSNALAIIFLSELAPREHRDLIGRFARVMFDRQKDHGGWGYNAYKTGDTSQTQYAALSFWELMQIGMAPDVSSVEGATNWLLRTQDPTGFWGYQGKDPGNFELVSQSVRPTSTEVSMLAAGLGSTLICANVLGILKPGENPLTGVEIDTPSEELPNALKRVAGEDEKTFRTLSGSGVEREKVLAAVARGQEWYDQNFKERGIQGQYPAYVLYSMERYKSFEEYLSGRVTEEPEWYQIGFEFLKEKQHEDGHWSGHSGDACATAFATLFLLRSTQQSIKASLGQGTLVGGRGLSANLARMQVRGGRLVTKPEPTEVDKFLEVLESSQGEQFAALESGSLALEVSGIDASEARRLQQIIKSGPPEARLLAVRALSQLRDLDYVPSLLYAMTDPDKRVVRAARDGLEFVSRRFEGYGPPDEFTDAERYEALDKWKNWYRRVRPNAPPLP